MQKNGILNMLLSVVKEFFIDDLHESAQKLARERLDKNELETYYNETIENLFSAIPDEWERELISEYITRNAPFQIDESSSIFDRSMRSRFISEFYRYAGLVCRSERIDEYLNEFLNRLEKKLSLKLEDVVLHLRLNDIYKNLEEIKSSVSKQNNTLAEDEIKRMVQLIKTRSKVFLNRYLICELKMYESVYETEFIEELPGIEDVFKNTWKNRIISLLRDGCLRNGEQYSQLMSSIRGFQEYEIIRGISQEIIEEGIWDEDRKKQIKRMLINPKYNKVFLVSGEMGSGKTYFIRNYIRHSLNKLDTIVVPISVTSFKKTVKSIDVIMEAINCVTGIEYESIEGLLGLIDNLCLKIVIVIDDIQSIYINDKSVWSEFVELIQKLTKYDSLSWILTINKWECAALLEVTDFLDNYCFSVGRYNDDLVPNVFCLDKYNERNGIIDKVLAGYGIEFISDETRKKMSMGSITFTPLFAHILGSCCDEKKKLVYPESQFSFIEKVVDLFRKRIYAIDDDSCLLNTVEDILQILHKSRRTCFEDSDVKNVNKENLKGLQTIRLLSSEEKKNVSIFESVKYGLYKKYFLQVEIYWAFRYTLQYCNIENDPEMREVCNLQLFPKGYFDKLMFCYLMYINSRAKDIEKRVAELFAQGFGYYAMYCVRNDCSKLENAVSNYLMESSIENDNKETVYSFLYYILYSRIAIENKYQLICKNARIIYDAGLMNIYSNVMRNITAQIKKRSKFKRKILKLAKCEVQQLNVLNGYVCGARYHEIISSDKLAYCDGISNIIKMFNDDEALVSVVDIDNGKNKTFLDFFIRGYYEAILRETGLSELYYFLIDNVFLKLSKELEHYFKRNFTCAAGNLYSRSLDRDAYKREYECLVGCLADSDEEDERRTAWFLIINSLGENDNRLNSTLNDVFVKLWYDPAIYRSFHNHEEARRILDFDGGDFEQDPNNMI